MTPPTDAERAHAAQVLEEISGLIRQRIIESRDVTDLLALSREQKALIAGMDAP